MCIAAFTGHRPERFGWNDEDEFECIELKRHLARTISGLREMGVDTFITGLARGVDIWAADIVLGELGTRLIAIAPCQNQAQRWSCEDRAHRDRIIASIAPNDYFCLYNRENDICLAERNRRMVDMCDVLLAVRFPGIPSGSACTDAYARMQSKPVLRLHPSTYQLSCTVTMEALRQKLLNARKMPA